MSKRPIRLIAYSLGFLLLISIIVVLITGVDIDGILRFHDRLTAFPTVEARYMGVIDKILDVTSSDKLLQNSDSQLRLLRGPYPGCIRAGTTRTYGTNQSYDEVLARFREAFPQSNWKWNEVGDHFTTEIAFISLMPIDPSAPAYVLNKDNYKTVYNVLLDYADPAVLDCNG